VEEPDLRELDGAVRNEDERSTLPLFLPCRNLGLYGDLLLAVATLVTGASGSSAALTFCNFHLLKKGMASIMIQGSDLPK